MTPNFQRIKDALAQHCLDFTGQYLHHHDGRHRGLHREGITARHESPTAALDEASLAIEIADAIGNAGIMELIEAESARRSKHKSRLLVRRFLKHKAKVNSSKRCAS